MRAVLEWIFVLFCARVSHKSIAITYYTDFPAAKTTAQAPTPYILPWMASDYLLIGESVGAGSAEVRFENCRQPTSGGSGAQ